MEIIETDVVVVGGGIAGAAAAFFLAEHRRVILLEMEPTAGYHTTGRSAAVWIENYGPPDVRMMSRASRAFFEAPPSGFAEAPLMRRRPCLFLAPPAQDEGMTELLADSRGMREITPAQAAAIVPILRPGYAARAAIEEDSFDMDVAALHGGFLRGLKARGGQVALSAPVERIDRANGTWRVIAAERVHAAPIVVNAAGAWADRVAAMAGVPKKRIQPMRRTACIVDGPPGQNPDWPLMGDVDGTWYARPEARTKLLVSPAEETPMDPHDVRPEEIDIATGIANMQEALDVPVRRIEHAWAGLRSFAPDRSLVIGQDPAAERFFWMAGQGGYGIQTSPAAGRLLADLVLGRAHDRDLAGRVCPSRFAAAEVAAG